MNILNIEYSSFNINPINMKYEHIAINVIGYFEKFST